MRDGAYIKRLSADLERWRGAGALSAAQSAALLDDARAHADVSRASAAAIAAALGAVLFGLGLLTFIAANWGAMAKSARMLAALALIWGTFAAAIVAFERRAAWIGQAFALCGALAIGAGVALIGQIYNIDGTAAGLLLIWSVGALATAIAFRSAPALILYTILAFLWFALARPETGFILDGARASDRSWGVYGLYYLPLWFAGAFLGRRFDSGAGMHLSALAMLVWLVLFLGDAVWAGGARQWLAAGVLIAAAGAAIGAGAEWARARYAERAASIALAWSAAAVGVGLLIAEFEIWDRKSRPMEMALAAAALALSTWAIAWGDAPGRRGVRGLAVALFAFECFYIYAALFQGLMDTALFLLGGGALLFALAFALRYLTRRKREARA